MFDVRDPGPDYQLVWPPELFRAEARALLERSRFSTDEAEFLLEEAFAGEAPRNDLTSAPSSGFGAGRPNPFDVEARPAGPSTFLASLAEAAEALPRWSEPRPYWSRRHGRTTLAAAPRSAPSVAEATKTLFDDLTLPSYHAMRFRTDWMGLVSDLLERGYLDRVAPRDCVDDPQPAPWDALNAEARDRVGVDDVWPLQPDGFGWATDLLYDLVEVVHDLVARPRSRYLHSYSGCGFHYSNFALAPGRALYRWRVNQLLTRHELGLQLAADGEDTGRLVHVAGDDRDELVRRVLVSSDRRDRDEVRHAVALFRSRGATREDKRSAVVALARVLEGRRRLLEAELLSKDEGALFEIANKFDVRHRNANQRPDYDDVYLDWIFWWYLATVELTDRLLARQP